MLNIEELSPRAHRITVMGPFHYEDAERIIAFAKERLEARQGGKGGGKAGGNLLVDLTALADFTFSAISDQLAHVPTMLQFTYSLDRIAIISDEDWLRSAARLESMLLPGVEYQVYDDDERDAALAWVMEEAQEPHRGAFAEIATDNPSIAAFELSGRLDSAESAHAIAMVEKRLTDPQCRRLLMVITSWHGFDVQLLFDFGLMRSKMHLIDEIDRYAIVGGPDWLGGTAQMMGALVKPEIRAFDLDERDEAMAWLSE
jgi:hypothetical protein